LDQNKTFECFVSCNKIRGTFLVKGDAFIINRSPDIRLACPGGLTIENFFIKALESTESYHIEGSSLELLDKNEAVSARFQAGS
jgi:heat shock protein HslJ